MWNEESRLFADAVSDVIATACQEAENFGRVYLNPTFHLIKGSQHPIPTGRWCLSLLLLQACTCMSSEPGCHLNRARPVLVLEVESAIRNIGNDAVSCGVNS